MTMTTIHPAFEDAYWRESHSSRPYTGGDSYESYQPAYRLGWEGGGRYGELNWVEAEPHLRQEWTEARGASELSWDEARNAARDAWDRLRSDADYSAENR